MNCEDVLQAIVGAIRAVPPAPGGSHKASFEWAESSSATLGSRSFQLEMAAPPGPASEYADGLGSTADPMVVEYQLSVVWHEEDRALYGYESVEIVRALRRLIADQIREIEVLPQAVLGAAEIGEDGDQFRALVWRVSVQFDSRSV